MFALVGLFVVSVVVALVTTPRERDLDDVDVTWLLEARDETEDAGQDSEADRASGRSSSAAARTTIATAACDGPLANLKAAIRSREQHAGSRPNVTHTTGSSFASEPKRSVHCPVEDSPETGAGTEGGPDR